MVSALLEHVEPHKQGKPPAPLPPATLPGTPTNFPIPAKKLIELAKALLEAENGIKDESLLAPSFRFEFPVVSLSRADYLKAVRSFNFKVAMPSMESHAYDWRVDPYETNRVWYTIRNTAIHTGPLTIFGRTIKPTNKVILGAPECQSYTFNEDGKCTSFTGGYVMDRRVGNCRQKGKKEALGALFGILAAIGQPIPQPGSITGIITTTIFNTVAFAHSIVDYAVGLVFGKKKEA